MPSTVACVTYGQVDRDFSQLFGKANSESVTPRVLMKRCHPSGPFKVPGELQIAATRKYDTLKTSPQWTTSKDYSKLHAGFSVSDLDACMVSL